MGIGVGTPSRIIDLLDSGMLSNIYFSVMQFAVSHSADLSRRIIIIKSGTGSGWLFAYWSEEERYIGYAGNTAALDDIAESVRAEESLRKW